MWPDFYKVEVIHYLNPHLIWVVNRDSVKKNELCFEQIGVYGVLPLNKTVDMGMDHGLELGLISQKCEEWVPATAVLMKKFFDSGNKVWFVPAHIEWKSSIFDDNVHRYGELIINTKSGKLKKLSEYLTDSGFAYANASEFHKQLSYGELKTKLSTIQTQEVIKSLENYATKSAKSEDIWINAIKQHTSVFRMACDFVMSLTLTSLEKQNWLMKVLRDKLKDFELCKDVEEESLGRACKIRAKEDIQHMSIVNE